MCVFAFASLGHHLPGMMRAYGDRELFDRFRWRFIIAPPFCFAVSYIFFVWQRLHGLELVLLFWATWHLLMQTYGFMRIYDMKRGRTGRWDVWLDFLACIAVFAAGIAFSDARVFGIVETLWLTGIPIFQPTWLSAFRWLVGLTTAVLLALFIFRSLVGRRASDVNWLKLLLLVSTALLYWASGQVSVNLLLGVAMFEIFHALQYFAIVWFYNRQKADRVGRDFGPLGAMFQGSWWGLPVYLMAIVAFGSIGWWGRSGDLMMTTHWSVALFAASAMLHFYYDGFIWKVSEQTTSNNLNINTTNGLVPSKARSWLVLRPIALVGVLAVLAICERVSRDRLAADDERRLVALVAMTPNLPELQVRFSQYKLLTGDAQASLQSARQAADCRPRSFAAQIALGNAAAQTADWESAVHAFERAIELQPNKFEALYGFGLSSVQIGNNVLAVDALRSALQIRPDHAQSLFQLGNAYYFSNNPTEAVLPYRRCIELQPDFADAYNNLGATLLDLQEYEQAAKTYQKAIELMPESAAAHYNLGLVYFFLGDNAAARQAVLHAIQLGQQASPELTAALEL